MPTHLNPYYENIFPSGWTQRFVSSFEVHCFSLFCAAFDKMLILLSNKKSLVENLSLQRNNFWLLFARLICASNFSCIEFPRIKKN